MTAHVVPFAQCEQAGAARVGGKALGLGRLTGHGLPVPPGFAITTDAYREHVAQAGLLDEVVALCDGVRAARAFFGVV